MLAVVEHDQHFSRGEEMNEPLLKRAPFLITKRKHAGDHLRKRVRVRQGSHLNEPRPVGVSVGSSDGHLQRQSRLARPSRADQRYEPAGGERIDHSVDLAFAADERRKMLRHVCTQGVEGSRRREAIEQIWVQHLQEPNSFRDVLQRVLAKITHLEVRTPGHLPARAGDKNLPAVRGGHDARGKVHRHPGVAVLMDRRLAGMNAHANAQRLHRPLMPGERALRFNGGEHRIAGAFEGNEERVALGAYLNAAVLKERPAKQVAVFPKNPSVVVTQRIQQTRRPLNVAEQERHDAGRKLHQKTIPLVLARKYRTLAEQRRRGFVVIQTERGESVRLVSARWATSRISALPRSSQLRRARRSRSCVKHSLQAAATSPAF